MTEHGNTGIGPSVEPPPSETMATDDHPDNPSRRDLLSTTIPPTPPTNTPTTLDPSRVHFGRSSRRRYQLWHKRSLSFGQPLLPFRPVADHHSTQGIPFTQDYGNTVGAKPPNVF